MNDLRTWSGLSDGMASLVVEEEVTLQRSLFASDDMVLCGVLSPGRAMTLLIAFCLCKEIRIKISIRGMSKNYRAKIWAHDIELSAAASFGGADWRAIGTSTNYNVVSHESQT